MDEGVHYAAYLDLRQQPKKFLEGDWDRVISRHVEACKDAGVHSLLCIVAENNVADFQELLNRLGERSQFVGDAPHVMPGLSVVPANGKVYALNF